MTARGLFRVGIAPTTPTTPTTPTIPERMIKTAWIPDLSKGLTGDQSEDEVNPRSYG